VLFPVQIDHEQELGAELGRLGSGADSPFARIRGTHFARLVVVPRLRDRRNNTLASTPFCLFFSAEFDAFTDGYLEAMTALMPTEADATFRHCENYPGAADPPAFKRWFREHELKAGFSLRGNPGAPVRKVPASLALRERIIAFAADTQACDPATLKESWLAQSWHECAPPPNPGQPDVPTVAPPAPAAKERAPAAVQQADLQGNILCGYGRAWAYGAYIFVAIHDAPAGRAWLDGLVGEVTTAVPWGDHSPLHTTNAAFSWEGLRRLGVDDQILRTFPDAFRQGMATRAPQLGDVGASDPERWDPEISDAHVLVTVTARSAEARDARVEELLDGAAARGLAEAHVEETAFLPGEREHFGFRDGISQPSIRDPRAGPWGGEGTRGRHGRPTPVAPGEFVLGYKDEGDALPPMPDRIGFNGSYMVVRKLEQDVAGFWRYIAELAGPDRARREWLAAKLVGRWRDGTPLVLSPDLPQPGKAADPDWVNNFGYAADGDGLRCPLGSHVRRANPRNGLDPDGNLSKRHRLVRRGMSYTGAGDHPERGLMFVAYQASIERQFEFLMSEWCNDGNAFGLGSDPDFIVGGAEGKMTVQGSPPMLIPMRSFVTTRGGGYFFAPGIAALRQIARLA
jgi:Dyp-type peroxidase family